MCVYVLARAAVMQMRIDAQIMVTHLAGTHDPTLAVEGRATIPCITLLVSLKLWMSERLKVGVAPSIGELRMTW